MHLGLELPAEADAARAPLQHINQLLAASLQVRACAAVLLLQFLGLQGCLGLFLGGGGI